MNTPSTSAAAGPSSKPGPKPAPRPLVKPNQSLDEFLEEFWVSRMEVYEQETPDFKSHTLPLARIKKVMKMDEDVKMISAEAPLIFSRACELFIAELTCRSYLIAESGKRKTLQRGDIAKAVSGSDAFDFLVDLDVEGKKSKPVKAEDDARSPSSEEAGAGAATCKNKKRKSKTTEEDDDE